jgi:hypothetical protein
VLELSELVRVDRERDRRVRLSELAADEDDVTALGDQERRERVPQAVEANARPPLAIEAGVAYYLLEPAGGVLVDPATVDRVRGRYA